MNAAPDLLADFPDDQTDNLILTPNKRLATTLKAAYDKQQQAKGKTCWKSLHCLPLQTWLETAYETALLTGVAKHALLSESQELMIWQSIIEKSDEILFKNRQTAQLAASTYRLLKRWQIPLDTTDLQTTDDSRVFIEWAKQFESICQKRAATSFANITYDNLVFTEKSIQLYAFIEITPDIQSLIDASRLDNIDITLSQTTLPARSKTALAFDTIQDELDAMLDWAVEAYHQHPDEIIACIIPNLSLYRDEIENKLYRHFDIDQQITGKLPFNVSSGTTLSETPIIYSALKALSLRSYQIPLDAIRHVLLSPFFADFQTQLADNEKLYQEIADKLFDHCSLSTLCQFTKRHHSDALSDRFQSLEKIDTKGLKKPSDWARCFSEILVTLGWPGDRAQNSAEFQAISQWQHLLDDFATLNFVAPPLSFQGAITHLQQLAATRLFQAQSIGPRIFVLGLLEASGLCFDRSWLFNTDHITWPTPANPNPFIPIALQRLHNMPHATPAREYDFCNTLSHQLQNSASHFTVSFSHHVDEQVRLCSPLFSHIPITQCDNTAPKVLTPKLKLKTRLDDIPPSVLKHETIRGGAALLKDQASCAFRAFANWRLHTKPQAKHDIGIDAKTRGIITHHILESIWQQLQSHHQLLAMSETDLDSLIKNEVNKAIQRHIPQSLIALETTRLTQLIHNWLKHEKNRTPFNIHALELKQKITLGPLTLSVQIDRIDSLPSGQHILIDYKTGLASPMDWLGTRPLQPQLPLYAVAHDTPLAAISFAHVTVKAMRFNGIALDQDTLIGCKQIDTQKAFLDSLEHQCLDWTNNLTELATAFHLGDARINPKNTSVCQYCELDSLCRVTNR
jgi:ATP-dependent helicase/nuclease subunit B